MNKGNRVRVKADGEIGVVTKVIRDSNKEPFWVYVKHSYHKKGWRYPAGNLELISEG